MLFFSPEAPNQDKKIKSACWFHREESAESVPQSARLVSEWLTSRQDYGIITPIV